MVAARLPPRSDPANSQAFLPKATPRSAGSAALFVRQIRPPDLTPAPGTGEGQGMLMAVPAVGGVRVTRPGVDQPHLGKQSTPAAVIAGLTTRTEIVEAGRAAPAVWLNVIGNTRQDEETGMVAIAGGPAEGSRQETAQAIARCGTHDGAAAEAASPAIPTIHGVQDRYQTPMPPRRSARCRNQILRRTRCCLTRQACLPIGRVDSPSTGAHVEFRQKN